MGWNHGYLATLLWEGGLVAIYEDIVGAELSPRLCFLSWGLGLGREKAYYTNQDNTLVQYLKNQS